LVGNGTASSSCEGACAGFDVPDTDYGDKTWFGMGIDVLGHVIPSLRIGGGIFWAPGSRVEFENSDTTSDIGSDLTTALIVEGVFDASSSIAVSVRGFGGAMIVFPGGELEDAANQLKEICNSAVTSKCDVDDGPYIGPTFGLGPGLIFPLKTISLRTDLFFQWYEFKVLKTDIEQTSGSFKTETKLTGYRIWLMGGVEF
jgi:hypothetical protein